MGGGQKTSEDWFQPTMEKLPYVTEGSGKPDPGYSDDYTKHVIDDRKRKSDELMNALQRLGFVPEAWPTSMPQIPYRASEPQIGF